ncbi:hypothetical protein ACA910_009749 [Epithemia clementina (nom. ined.)]
MATAASSSSSAAASAGTLEERLLAMLAMPDGDDEDEDGGAGGFSTAAYLNLALNDYLTLPPTPPTRSTPSAGLHHHHHHHQPDLQQQRMAELALQLQLQTQSCHEDIGRIGAELQAILPRCHADVGRIGVGLQGLQQDAATLMEVTTANHSPQQHQRQQQQQQQQHQTSSDNQTKNSGGEKKVMGGGGGAGSSTSSTNTHVSSSLETLSTLHALQANLKRTHEILTAAATWDTTLAEIPPLLAPVKQPPPVPSKGDAASAGTTPTTTTSMASNLPLAVQKLAILEKGETALRGMPHPEERSAALTKLRVQISNLLSPQLQHALQQHTSSSSRLGPLQQCVSLYSQLNMLDTLVQHYVTSRPKALHKAWFDHYQPPAAPPNPSSNNNASNDEYNDTSHDATPLFVEWLPTWFESVLQLLQEERRQASSVFGAASPHVVPTILALVLQETFRPLLPSFASRLSTVASSSTSTSSNVAHLTNLNLICHLYKATLQFLAMAYETIAACWLDWAETSMNTSSHHHHHHHSESARVSTESSSSTRIQNGISMYQKIMSICKQIVSPFSKYQMALPQLEQKNIQLEYSGTFTRLVQECLPFSKQQQQQQQNRGNVLDLDDLSKATDGLLVVARDHLVQQSGQEVLGRFEFLQGGYHALKILDTMDQGTQQRIQFLVTNLARLGQSALNNHNNNTGSSSGDSSWDEEHVLAALQVLKIAATCQSLVSQLKQHIQQRFHALAEQISRVVTREKEIILEQLRSQKHQSLQELRYGGRATGVSSTTFVLPDSLSPVEINAYLCLYLFAPKNDTSATAATQAAEAALSVLQRLGGSDGTLSASTGTGSTTTAALMAQTTTSVAQLASACHKVVFQVCFSVPQKQLQSMAALPTWKKKDAARDDAGEDADAVTDSYGILPQSYITQVGEHMLALVQALEPFALDPEALDMANKVMHNIRQVAEQPWSDFVLATGMSLESSPESKAALVQQLMNGKEIKEFAAINNDGDIKDVENEKDDDEDDGDEREDGDESDQKVTAFCNAWLDVIGLAVTGRLVERILNIPQLTAKGCEHLKADLDYLQNVLVALGVAGHPHPLLDHVSQVISMDLGSLQERIQRLNHDNKKKMSPNATTTSVSLSVRMALLAMEERLAAMRGVGGSFH